MVRLTPAAPAASTASRTPATPNATQRPPSIVLPGVPPEVLESVRDGGKVHAIKLYRDRTGASLQEAKTFIDDVQRRLEAMQKTED
jgi:ribosomal protein L7/L12